MSARATPAPSIAARTAAIAPAAAARASFTVAREIAIPSRRSAMSGWTDTRPVPPTTIVPVAFDGSVKETSQCDVRAGTTLTR